MAGMASTAGTTGTASTARRRRGRRDPVEWYVAGGLFAVLATVGTRYGWHRDELYFITAGRHPAWGYPDQPPLTPLLAAGWDVLTGDRLGLFRLLPALAAALLCPLAAATSRRLGGTRTDQAGAAVLTALAVTVVAMGHLFSTSTFTLLATAAVIHLAIRAVQLRTPRAWLLLGLTAGVALQVQLQPGLVLACGVVAILLAGPRAALRSPWPWAAALLALAVAAPYLVWQTGHGWPQLEVAADIAAGGSTSSAARWQIVPFQAFLAGPLLLPVLLAGLWALARRPELRWVALAYGLFLALITVTGGKPYYTSGFVPVLLAAGVPVVRSWLTTRARTAVAGVVLLAHLAGAALICLPLAPPGSAGFDLATAADPDVAETVGWPQFQAAANAHLLSTGPPAQVVALTANYGEAGALDQLQREQPAARRFRIYSGHNGYGEWGPPPDDVRAVLVIGDIPADRLSRWFQACTPLAPFDGVDGVDGVDNEERGAPFRSCVRPREPWARLWPQIRHNG